MKIYIKHMACESCKIIVKEALDELNIATIKVDLGEAEIKGHVTDEEKEAINKKIKKAGLELLEGTKGILLEKIRLVMVDHVYHSDQKPFMKFSVLLSEELNYSYNYLATFFAEVQAVTITQYLISMKIERVKELIMMEDSSIQEIANRLNYSSAAHLSTQFKKITGLTPKHFKNLKEKRRLTVQQHLV